MQIILDYPANNHQNNKAKIKKAVDQIKAIDSGKHEIFFKTQLFRHAGDNLACTEEMFEYFYNYCSKLDYKCTASVFDKPSLDFLLKFDVPFIKIACNEKYYHLIGEIPRKYKVLVSVASRGSAPPFNVYEMSCVPEYPAIREDYYENFDDLDNLSDHTVGLELVRYADPMIWEKHLKLDDSIGPDAGSFAATPDELKSIL